MKNKSIKSPIELALRDFLNAAAALLLVLDNDLPLLEKDVDDIDLLFCDLLNAGSSLPLDWEDFDRFERVGLHYRHHWHDIRYVAHLEIQRESKRVANSVRHRFGIDGGDKRRRRRDRGSLYQLAIK